MTPLRGETNTSSLHLAVAVLGHSVRSHKHQRTPTPRQHEIKNPGIPKFGVYTVISGVKGNLGKQALSLLSVVYFEILLVAKEHMALDGRNISE